MEVELLKKSDIENYINLIKEIFEYEPSKESIEKLIKKEKVLIVKKNNDIIASVQIVEGYEYIKCQKFYHLYYFCVKKDYRRQGIASKLFDKVEELASKNDINYVELTSGNQRRQAYYFYKSKDFKIKDTTVFVKFY